MKQGKTLPVMAEREGRRNAEHLLCHASSGTGGCCAVGRCRGFVGAVRTKCDSGKAQKDGCNALEWKPTDTTGI